jgi:hypothetical protein
MCIGKVNLIGPLILIMHAELAKLARQVIHSTNIHVLVGINWVGLSVFLIRHHGLTLVAMTVVSNAEEARKHMWHFEARCPPHPHS